MSTPQNVKIAHLIEAIHEVNICLLAIEKTLKRELADIGVLGAVTQPTPYICGTCHEALTPCEEMRDKTSMS